MFGLALADFGHDPHNDLTRSRIFCEVNNARFRRFPVRQILRHFTTRRSMSSCKLSELNFEKITISGRFFKKTQKMLKKFQALRLQAVITSQ